MEIETNVEVKPELPVFQRGDQIPEGTISPNIVKVTIPRIIFLNIFK